MDAKQPETSPSGLQPLSDEEIAIAVDNLARCLEGLDERGEEGLQDALDRIYPPETRPLKTYEIEGASGGRIRVTEHPPIPSAEMPARKREKGAK